DISIPAQGARDVQLVELARVGSTVFFQIPDVPGAPSFEGTLSDDGGTISGTLTQAGQSIPFEMTRGDRPAEAARAALEGFDEIVEQALYHSLHGYYTGGRVPWGEVGDYLTAPQLHSAFGVAVATMVREVDALLDAPEPFVLVEVGSGDGSLLLALCDALAECAAELYARLQLWSVERSAPLRQLQLRRLHAHRHRLHWAKDISELRSASVRGGILSNEFFDALPVHRLVGWQGEVREIYVDVQGEQFVELLGPPSTKRLLEYFSFNGISLQEGQVAEVSLLVGDWITAAADKLRSGFLLTVDYGADTEALYAPERRSGTLICQHRYRLTNNPYTMVGAQDITAHVDFGNLRRCGRAHALDCHGQTSLMVFLLGYGAAGTGGLIKTDAEARRMHLALRHLLFSEIGQTHRVMLQSKGLGLGSIPFGRERLVP
ncbi:MAG: class I SAM-dependent methyltransferase, partial [Acidobacteriota bacterium]